MKLRACDWLRKAMICVVFHGLYVFRAWLALVLIPEVYLCAVGIEQKCPDGTKIPLT